MHETAVFYGISICKVKSMEIRLKPFKDHGHVRAIQRVL